MGDRNAGQEGPTPHLTDEQRAAIEESVNRQPEAKPAPHMVRQLYTTDDPEAWKGTPPAEGTRRALIRDAIADVSLAARACSNSSDFSLLLADAVEEALLKIDIGADPTGEVSPASTAMDVLDQLEIPRTREGAILTIADRVTVLADQLVELRRDRTDVDRLNAIAEERWQRIGELEERLEQLAGFTVAQRDSHHTLRETDLKYTEYHRGAELAYALIVERLGGESAAVATGQAWPEGSPERRLAEARSEGKVPPGTRELHVILEPIKGEPGGSPDYRFVEVQDQDGRSVEFPWRGRTPKNDGFFRVVIPYGRDDAWVSEVAYQAAGAATRPLMEDHPDYVFPAERVQEAVAYLLETFGVPRACTGCQEEQLEHGRKEAASVAEDRGEAPAPDVVPDEFSCAAVACERLMERLEEGPVPNAAELARVIDILRNGNGAAYRLSPAMAEALGGIEDRLSEIRDGVRD